jgi:hypothetical protein
MTCASIVALYCRTLAFAERIVSGRFASLRIAVCASALTLVFTTFPNYPKLWDAKFQNSDNSYWPSILDKRDNLFLDLGRDYGVGSHAANANFRLTVPLIAKVLGLGMFGMLIVQSVCGVLLLWVVARIVLKITADLVASLFVTCGVASTWAGTTSFTELHGVFDGEALLFISCAALFEKPWLAGLFVFLGAWTDERALIASSLIYLYHVYRRQRQGFNWRASYCGATPIAVVGAWVAYFVLRFTMMQYCHMTATAGAVSLRFVIINASNLPIGSWTALEGGWLLAFAAMVILAQKRRIVFLILYILAISLVLVVSMTVIDITRSMAYALPAIFVAIEVLREVESDADLRVLCAVSSAVAILWPNYYCYNRNNIAWLVPLPVRILQWCVDARRGGPVESGLDPGL